MNLLEIAESIQEDLTGRIMDEYLSFALVFVGIFAVSKIIINIFPYLSAPEKEWDHMKIFVPVLLIILLLFYPSFINFNRKIMGSFAEIEINSDTKLCITNFNIIERDIINIGKDKVEEEQKLADTFTEEFEEDAINTADLDSEEEFEDTSNSWIVKGLKSFAYFLGSVAKTVVIGLQTVFLSILEIGGPIAICMSLFPSLESSFKKWYGIYLQTFLWLPVTNIIDAIVIALNSKSNINDASGLWQFSLTIVLLISYLLVPKISSFFISSKEGGGIVSMAAAYSYQSVIKAINYGKNLKRKKA